jgi:hypothetical protein
VALDDGARTFENQQLKKDSQAYNVHTLRTLFTLTTGRLAKPFSPVAALHSNPALAILVSQQFPITYPLPLRPNNCESNSHIA